MKYFIVFCLFVTTLFAQYSKEDYELLKTTFLREFNKEIINDYLNSGNDEKINAALLSIAQSEDTNFVSKITQLDFKKYGSMISFALGKLGECMESSNYLLNQLSKKESEYSVQLYDAIGKIGNEEDLIECTDIFETTNNNGFPLAVFNFHLRGIVDTTGKDIELLVKDFKTTKNKDRLLNILFTLYRVAPDKVNPSDLEPILNGDYNSTIKLYALGILRKNSSFPFSFDLFKKLVYSDDWSVRCEAARTVCYFPFENSDQVDAYLNLLFDENPNVARTAAQSLVNLNIEDEQLETEFIDILDTLIGEDFTSNVKGEILIALQYFYPDDTVELLNIHGNDVDLLYSLQLLGNYTYDPYYSFETLTNKLANTTDYENFLIHSSLANFYDSLKTDANYASLILEQYTSGSPLSIVLYNFVIDSSFAAAHSAELKENINQLVSFNLSNPEYNQAISTLFNFTDYIDTNFTNNVLKQISASDNYDLQYDLRNEIELSEKAKTKREELFNKLFENTFKYSKAVVTTDKGNFTIEFNPEFAPISVGNFIYLAEQGFYDNVNFHRVVPNFVIQSGDPSGTGWSGPSHTIISEFSPQPFDTYYVGMASAGKDTEGSQWFVMQNNYPHLNGNYTNFGKVIDGRDVVVNIDQYDLVKEIELIK